MKAVSLFAGVGGFDLAMQRAGIETVAAVEIDGKCRDVLATHFPNTKLFNDVSKVGSDELRAVGFDPLNGIITGGFPCQDLSVAGARKGLAGTRSRLFWEIVRLADELEPKYLVLENVVGLLSSNNGRDMGVVIGTLEKLGYGICWRVLDAKNFGVPQRRRRLFIVCCLRNHRRPVEILFEPNDMSVCFEPSRKIQQTDSYDPTKPIGFSHTQGFDLEPKSDYLPTLRQGGWSLAVLYDDILRRLTAIECERIQGFPDDWTVGQAEGQRYKQMGNAVAVPVVEWIMRRLVKAESTRSQHEG